MKCIFAICAAILLTVAVSPGTAAAKSASPDPAVVVTVTLTAVAGGPSGTVSPMAAGQWNAGCQYSAFNALGQVIYSYTIWQQFATDGSRIYYYPSPTYSASAYWGWALTSAPTPTPLVGDAADISGRPWELHVHTVCGRATVPVRVGLGSGDGVRKWHLGLPQRLSRTWTESLVGLR